MRHIKFTNLEDLHRNYVRRYIRASIEQLGEAAAKGGTGKTVVKSSLKDNPAKKRSVKRGRAKS